MKTMKERLVRSVLWSGHIFARHPRLSHLGGLATWYAMCGITNASNYDMDRNGERWLIERSAAALAGRSVIDVGANMGNWTAHVLATAPTAQVYSVEMVPTFAAALRERFGTSATVIECALSDRVGAVTGYRVGGGGRIPNVASPKETEPIELHTRTGDDLVAEFGLTDVTMIKIDVDGYDIKTVRGFARTIAEQRPIVQFEYSKFYIYARSYLKDAYEFFDPLGYRVGRLMPSWIKFGEGLIPLNPV